MPVHSSTLKVFYGLCIGNWPQVQEQKLPGEAKIALFWIVDSSYFDKNRSFVGNAQFVVVAAFH